MSGWSKTSPRPLPWSRLSWILWNWYLNNVCTLISLLLQGHSNPGRQVGFWVLICASSSHSWAGMRAPRGLVKAGPIPRAADSVGLGLGPINLHFYQIPMRHWCNWSRAFTARTAALRNVRTRCFKRSENGLGFLIDSFGSDSIYTMCDNFYFLHICLLVS